MRADPSIAIPSRGARLRGHLGIAAPSMIDHACAAKDRFGVRTPDDGLERFATAGGVVDVPQVAGAQA